MKKYLEFIEESKDALEKISSSWERRHPGMKFILQRSGKNNIRLAKIEVPKEKRGQGIGTRAIRGLTRYADKTGSTVSLSPEPERGYKTKLNKMYSSHGFKKIQETKKIIQ